MASGIYKITNLANGKIYIGSSNWLANRFSGHLSKLRNGIHQNQHLQSAFNKYKECNFKFEVIEITEIENLLNREQFWIDALNAHVRGIGYNICRDAKSTRGHKHSAEAKLKMSIARKGIKKPESSKENYRRAALLREFKKNEGAPAYVKPEWLSKVNF